MSESTMNTVKQATPGDIAGKLNLHASAARPGKRRLLLWLLAGLLLAGMAYLLLRAPGNGKTPQYASDPARRGDLTVTVAASGTLAPTNEVEVGSELSGIVERVLVEVNDRVMKGQVLARLDISKLQDAVVKSEANLSAAEAQVRQAQATVAEARANLGRLRQVAELSGGKVPSKLELDSAEATLQRAVANESVAHASVDQQRAVLKSDRTNLAKASIVSPIDGVVLARKVEPGQTVAASLSAPVLFKLAEDLTRMELRVKVDEADVGKVKAGQEASFGVDAWPGRRYAARITRVNYGSTTTDQVVSYETTLEVDNRDLSLRPGMTASAEIVALRLKDALLIANPALRFAPPEAAPAKKSGGLVSALLPRPPAPREKKAGNEKKSGTQRIWVLKDGQATPVDIVTGQTDGKRTEVTAGNLKPGDRVITDTLEAAKQ